MARVFKRRYSTRRGARKECRTWTVRFADHLGILRELPGFADRAASVELGRFCERLAARRAAGEPLGVADLRRVEALPARLCERLAAWGLIEAARLACTKPLADHLEDFEAHLRAKGDTPRHARQTAQRALRVLQACGFRMPADLDAGRVEATLADLRSGGMCAATSNYHLGAVKAFCRWAVRERRLAENPLAHLSPVNARADRRVERRALTADECRRLLAAAEAGPAWRGVSGPERALVYRLALETGLRWSELRSLTRSDFSLGDLPTVRVRAAYAKNRREDVLPLRDDTAARLRMHLAMKTPTAPAFALPMGNCGAKMLRFDLERAGIAYRDHVGRVADFHALRHTFVSALARAGVHVAVAQRLARHSTAELTLSRYTHLTMVDKRTALDALPDLGAPARREAAEATGTDGKRLSLPLSFSGGSERPFLGPDGAENATGPEGDGMRRIGDPLHSTRSEGMVRPGGLEPPTRGLRIRCSTD